MNPPMTPMMPPVTMDGPLMLGFMPANWSIKEHQMVRWEGWRDGREKVSLTGEVADGNGDAGDGEEAAVVEEVEIGDGLREGRVPIHHRILRLRHRCDVRIHLSLFSALSLSLGRSLRSLLSSLLFSYLMRNDCICIQARRQNRNGIAFGLDFY